MMSQQDYVENVGTRNIGPNECLDEAGSLRWELLVVEERNDLVISIFSLF
jgi:hypothetical protein